MGSILRIQDLFCLKFEKKIGATNRYGSNNNNTTFNLNVDGQVGLLPNPRDNTRQEPKYYTSNLVTDGSASC